MNKKRSATRRRNARLALNHVYCPTSHTMQFAASACTEACRPPCNAHPNEPLPRPRPGFARSKQGFCNLCQQSQLVRFRRGPHQATATKVFPAFQPRLSPNVEKLSHWRRLPESESEEMQPAGATYQLEVLGLLELGGA